jgi:LAO/AO transport system kinase
VEISNKFQPPQFYINGILKKDIAILSRAITIIESQNEAHKNLAEEIVNGIQQHTGNSFRLAITGVPGVGKSTFIESFGNEIILRGHKLAVLAIDPSSTKNKGSILGDKTRMETLSANKNAYIRPTPTSGTLGGIARNSYETILLCEAAGFDFIIIETVGVGQSETLVSKITDFFLLLMLSGAGDELQGIKRGIMEMADALVITKADGQNVEKAKLARAEYAHAIQLFQPPESGWIPEVKVSSSIENTGILEVYNMIEKYRQMVVSKGYFSEKRKQQSTEIFKQLLEEEVLLRFYKNTKILSQLQQIKADENVSFHKIKAIVDKFTV